jgi:hypothetical protein
VGDAGGLGGSKAHPYFFGLPLPPYFLLGMFSTSCMILLSSISMKGLSVFNTSKTSAKGLIHQVGCSDCFEEKPSLPHFHERRWQSHG